MTDVSKLKASSGRAGRKHGGTVCIFIFLLLLAVFMALPIYLAVVMSVKPSQEWFIFPPKFYAMDPTLDNFREMFRAAGQLWVPFSRYVANSVFVTAAVTLAQCFTASMAAFVLAKGKFRGSKFLNSVIVISLLYQSNVIYIVQYIFMSLIQKIDRIYGYINIVNVIILVRSVSAESCLGIDLLGKLHHSWRKLCIT